AGVDRLDGNMLMSADVAERLGLYKAGDRFYTPAQIWALLPWDSTAVPETFLVTWVILGRCLFLSFFSTTEYGDEDQRQSDMDDLHSDTTPEKETETYANWVNEVNLSLNALHR
ncbi:unnamed protein product, partial [Symbiodinium pilosum]